MNSYLEIAMHNRRIPMVNYLKGFSIATIVLMHLLDIMPFVPSRIITLSAIGGTGVHVFFLCSGIGLYYSHRCHPLSYGAFLKKRFLKIYTAYIPVIFLSFLLPWMYSESDRAAALLSHVFLFKMFVPRYEESFGVQFWFVSTLFQLYALFIPLCRLKDKLRRGELFVGVTLGISILWWIFCYITAIDQYRIWGSFCLQYLWEFALGFVLADAFYEGKTFRVKNYLLLIFAVAGIGLQAGLAMLSDTLKIFNDIPALLGYASLALVCSNIPLINGLCRKISVFSYELFLIHMLVFETVFHFVKPEGLLMAGFWGILSVLAAIFCAWLYHLAINRNAKKPVYLFRNR